MTISKPRPTTADQITVRSGTAQNGAKYQQLNRFISKTFHMVNNSDTKIVSWAPTGDSFVVKDVDKFSTEVLPLYFKHSKFTSFVRQLNFYGFRKIRLNCSALRREEDMPSTAVRFYHEYFQASKPNLLHRIHRATKAAEPINLDHVESLQTEIHALSQRLNHLLNEMDSKLMHFRTTLELDYQSRLTKLEKSYHEVVGLWIHASPAAAVFPSGPSMGTYIHPSVLAVSARGCTSSFTPGRDGMLNTPDEGFGTFLR